MPVLHRQHWSVFGQAHLSLSLSPRTTRVTERGKFSMQLTSVIVLLAVVLAAAATPFLLYNVWLAFLSMCWTPLRIRRAFQAQGIPTLPFHFFHGNLPELVSLKHAARSQAMPLLSHDIAPRLLPHCYHWAHKYGASYVHWFGSQARYNLVNAEDAKYILATKFGHFAKPIRHPNTQNFVGNGILFSEGEEWAQHRRTINPSFFLDRLKAMIPTMEVCTTTMMESWASSIGKGQAIDVHKSLKDLTADIIAHTAFGSSFAEGKQVFELQSEQQLLMDKALNSPYVPGARFIPTASNRRAWKMHRDIKRGLCQVIHNRKESVKFGRGDLYGNDLLGLIMAANKHERQGNQKNLTYMSIDDLIDECKTFFFAGHETTASLLTWTFLLLSIHPEWQTRTRDEVIAVCGTTAMPTASSTNHLKIMDMVLNETLRLYPPVIMMMRQASRDMQLGKVVIPKGTVLTLPIISWHHDERYWGADASEFHPERFSAGVAKASRVPGAFMPFSMGPRVCIGQNFALLEAKVVLVTILRRYRFHLSPSYKHAPSTLVTLQPQLGMPILFEKL